MTLQIMTRSLARERARAAFEAGKGRESHSMNWHAPSLVEWYAEYDRLAAERLESHQRDEVTA